MKAPLFLYRHFPRLTLLLAKLAKSSYEPEMEYLDVICDQGKMSLDIGAKVGMYSYRLARHSSSVVAFEPIPRFHNMLKVALKGVARVEPVAVSNEIGEAVLRMPYEDGAPQFGRSTIEKANDLSHGNLERITELTVPLRTIDSYSFDSVGMIKIDVEGHELAALEGARETIERCHPNLMIEANEHHCTDAVAKVWEFLGGLGYRGVFLDKGKFHDIETFDLNEHFAKRAVENFIFFHSTGPDLGAALNARA